MTQDRTPPSLQNAADAKAGLENSHKDRTLGEVGHDAFFEGPEHDAEAAWEVAGFAIRDAVISHVINRMKLYAMLNAKPGKSAMEYSHGVLEMLQEISPQQSGDRTASPNESPLVNQDEQ